MRTLTILFFLAIGLTASFNANAQDVYLSAYKKFSVSSTDVETISFSEDSKIIGAADKKGNVSLIEIESSSVLKKIPASGKVIFHEFLDKDKKFIAVRANGQFSTYPLSSFEESRGSQTFPSLVNVTLDPNQVYLTVLEKNNQIEVFDLKAGMTQTRIQSSGDLKNALFLGFDRFGQQLAAINNIGESFSWEFINQKFLRELKLQSGEYSGSRSVIHSASASKGSDNFVVGLQEVFIPKGGLQPGRQPERRNMLIAYDWTTGQEKKRVALRYRPDGLAMGPTASTLFYYSSDSRNIFVVNLDKGEVNESVSVDERPSSITLSDDGSILAVGTVSGMIYLYEVVRNNPAEIRITTPTINRNYGEQLIQGTSVTVEGKVEGTDRMAQVLINDQRAELNPDGTFKGIVNLVPGKNRVRVAAQNTQSQVISKDLYLNSEPARQKPATKENSVQYNKRIALVIGNADYTAASKLKNTLNDAKAMTATLKGLGFDVTTIENGNYETIKNAIYAFGDRIQDVDVSLFFYAGHGIEVDGANYLVPVDADIQSHLDVKQKCIPLSGVSNTMEFANDEGLNMIILDACRNNPFPAGKRGGTGLARINAPSGTLIAYATDPGSVASDGDGTNGLYTGELIKQLKISQRIEDIFMHTRNNVEQLSGGKQRPWEEARLKGIFYLK
ncbi:MAG TPA: caspase family protein [Cyclobacteriaceae bacterium]|nr:caspase family protein [Cyclobacteriaceae bacterium]HMV07653.1 caspase family protein [Cyclobacteriaceae bacterium]HMV88454.1 caspase family protein [Cyclobacteriaceae bacterium]HMW98788.1 caspase family protein [Cyclobacteriaceae bacterium]HMX48579.1 caspase family protein [Cyclobacteriaceae bacterium]